MKLLFLDDNQFRHDHCYPRALDAGVEIYHVKTISEFIAAELRWGPFDLYSLDHDLGEGHYTQSGCGEIGGCGCDAARILELLAQHHVNEGKVVVHSYNKPAGEKMISIMGSLFAKWFPFGDPDGWRFLMGEPLVKGEPL